MNSKLKAPNQPSKEEGDKIYLINPSVEEFTTSYFDDKNVAHYVVLAPLETKEFPMSIGKTILNHLVDFILNQGGFSYKTDVNLEKEEIRKKCIIYE